MDIREIAEMFLDGGFTAQQMNDMVRKVKEEREAEKHRRESQILQAREDLIQSALNYALVAGLATKEEIDKVDINSIFIYIENLEKGIKTLKNVKVKAVPKDVDLDIIKRFVEGI
jgi:hypothetical protein